METVKIRIYGDEDSEVFTGELPWRLPSGAELYTHIRPDFRFIKTEQAMGGGGNGVAVELIIGLVAASVPVTVAVVKAIRDSVISYMNRDEKHWVTLEREDKQITIKGHSIPEEKEIIEALFPDYSSESVEPAPSVLTESFEVAEIRVRKISSTTSSKTAT